MTTTIDAPNIAPPTTTDTDTGNGAALAGYDPVVGMCTATTPTPHRNGWCTLPFAHPGPCAWSPEYRQPCASCGDVLVTPPRLECAGCRAEGWTR